VGMVSPLKNKRAWYMLSFFGLQSSLFFSTVTWLAPIAIDKGLSIVLAGGVLTVVSIVGIMGNLTLPFLLERWPSRHLWILVSIFSGVLGVLMLMFAGTQFIWVAAFFLGITLGS